MARIALQLYTVREDCERDFEGTLRAVAELGYECVELHSLFTHSAEQVRAWLDQNGLDLCGRHVSLDAIENELPRLVADAEILRTKRTALAWIEPPTTAAEADAVVARLGRIAAATHAVGLDFGFHNHDGELRVLDDGRSFLDRLTDQPLFLELDLGWVWWAGVDPAELLVRLAGRSPLVHVKDFPTRDEPAVSCPVGEGVVGYERIVPAAVAAGVEWLIVEQDETQGPALDSAARSIAGLRPMLGTA